MNQYISRINPFASDLMITEGLTLRFMLTLYFH